MASANPLLHLRIGACTDGIRCDVGGLADSTPGVVTYLTSLEMYPDGCGADICQNCIDERRSINDELLRLSTALGITLEDYFQNLAIEEARGQEQAAAVVQQATHFGGAAAVIQRSTHFGGAAAVVQREEVDDDEDDAFMKSVYAESAMLARTQDTRNDAKALKQIDDERKQSSAAEVPKNDESGSFCTMCEFFPPYTGIGPFNLTDGEPICLKCCTQLIQMDMSCKPVLLLCDGCGLKYPTSSKKCHSGSCVTGSRLREVSQCFICQDLKRDNMNPLVTEPVIGRDGRRQVLCGPVCCNDCSASARQSFFASLPPL